MTTAPLTENPDELSKIYQTRFSGQTNYRMGVWKILIRRLLSRWITKDGAILDLGAGHGEFINQVEGRALSAMDMNPDTARYLDHQVRFLQQSCCEPWPVASNTLDLIFTSNFFEHLPDKNALKQTLQHAYLALKPGGRLVALGPNIRLLPGAYWDFWDHYLPLTEHSLSEIGRLTGFSLEKALAATLPYSMSQGFQPPLWAVRVYLALPFLWRFFGKQFLVVLKKPA
jgi:SAM-dependent methyltransferase